MLKEWLEKAKISKALTFHGLRHTFAMTAVARGIDIYALKELMVHASIESTLIYAKISKDISVALSEGLDKLRTFSKLNVLTMPNSLYSASIRTSIQTFCSQTGLPVEFHTGVTGDIIRKNEVYLLLNSQHDTGLLTLARVAKEQGLVIGEDISVISKVKCDFRLIRRGTF